MIVGISGKIAKKEPAFVHIETLNGITYKINISLNTFSNITSEEIFLHVTQVIREDYQGLYGFFSENEKSVFDTLIKLNGIGPSIALAICSTMTPDEFAKAIASQDIEAFKKVSGIGPKGAKRILVELGDFSLKSDTKDSVAYAQNEALTALEGLGFKKELVKKILSTCSGVDTASIIKEALKKLG
ncbi:MAG: Holliday junction branch migration protein RuvA [Sulfurospirillaceae bacterium]|nr:Holliday junction branch migration protein RuvA [Sulfurospirillaceae bacterium]